MIDLHAHILPGVDDGPRDAVAAVELLACLESEGVTAVVATPHMLDGRFDVTRARLFEALAGLRRASAAAGLAIQIHPGAELLAQPGLPERVRDGTAVTLADGGRYLLLETSFQVVPPETRRLVFDLALAGVVPVLAHPERTAQVQRDPDLIEPLVEGGTLVQINASSLTGEGGEAACAAALALLDRGLAHIVASDAHGARCRPPRLRDACALLRARVGEIEADAMVRDRPGRIVRGEMVEVPPRVRARTGGGTARMSSWWRRVLAPR